ncbi:MAG: hypothetical protein K2G30_02110 [Muribaculaceae bacterium]|nr:hypothetical protein [Muribaculaceae bacterium]
MKHKIAYTLLACALAAGSASFTTQAQTRQPIIEFHTTLYDDTGDANAFHFVIGAKEATYIEVDYGFGIVGDDVEPAVFDVDTQAIVGTTISGSVSKEGNVRIYGDASLIDYLDLEGCYITDLSFPALTEVAILNLNHNLLKSLDLSHMTKLEALYISDNPFDVSPLVLGADKPYLTILDMSLLGALDESFDFSDYPSLRSAQVWSVPTLRRADTSKCPNLMQLSIDATNVESVDVSKNPNLLILNVSETRVTSLDVSANPYLTELYCGHNSATNSEYKLTSLDVSANPLLQRLNCAGNALTQLDVTRLPALSSLSCQRTADLHQYRQQPWPGVSRHIAEQHGFRHYPRQQGDVQRVLLFAEPLRGREAAARGRGARFLRQGAPSRIGDRGGALFGQPRAPLRCDGCRGRILHLCRRQGDAPQGIPRQRVYRFQQLGPSRGCAHLVAFPDQGPRRHGQTDGCGRD